MSLEIPKLLQSNAAYIHDIVTLRDGRFGVFPGDSGAQRLHKSCQVFVEREQAEVLGGYSFGGLDAGVLEMFLVCGDVLGV